MKLNTLLVLWALSVPAAYCSNGPAVARVNGEEISQLRLERYFAEYLEDQGRSVGDIRNPKAYKQLRKAALDALIDKELLWQEALKRGVVISDATVQSQVEKPARPSVVPRCSPDAWKTPVSMRPAMPNTPAVNWRPSKCSPTSPKSASLMKNRYGHFSRSTAPR